MTKSAGNAKARLDAAWKSMQPMDPSEALGRLRALAQSMPNFARIEDDHSTPDETLAWLGQLTAVIKAMRLTHEEVDIRFTSGLLTSSKGLSGGDEIRAILHRAIAAAELAAPASDRGAFIAVGNQLDAYAAISKPLASAQEAVLIVDPYMDGQALLDFVPSATEGVMVQLLADEAWLKPSLLPAVQKWEAQFGAARPIEARLAPPRTLHDRLIVVDGSEVWSLTQSLKDFANRSPGTVMKVDPETAAMKAGAYAKFWSEASPLHSSA